MKVFIANFGRENYEWPECLARGTVATMNEVVAQRFWDAGDREGYIQERMKGKTAAGNTPTRPVASRWFNLMSIVSATSGDLWIHREKDQFWWTVSKPDAPMFIPKVEPLADKRNVIICHKPCEPWRNRTRTAHPLDWNGLHPKARDFLSTESTLQQLTDDNAAFAIALIDGDDLTPWYSRPTWKAKAEKTEKNPVTYYDAKKRAAWRMANTAMGTAAASNGQKVLKTVKNKEVRFPNQLALETYVIGLIDDQDGNCAITGISLQFDGTHDDVEMLASLDRIDSNGHYEPGNLQIVCRFINRWKCDGDDGDFRRLIGVLKSSVTA